jgi:hypothetical protein
VNDLDGCSKRRRVSSASSRIVGGKDEHSPEPLSTACERVSNRLADMLRQVTGIVVANRGNSRFYRSTILAGEYSRCVRC